jgi:hypothetical protein
MKKSKFTESQIVDILKEGEAGALGLNLPRRTKRRLPSRLRQPLIAPLRLNEIWALDFMADALYSGRPFRTLNIIDEGNRETLGIEVATSIPSLGVIRVLTGSARQCDIRDRQL